MLSQLPGHTYTYTQRFSCKSRYLVLKLSNFYLMAVNIMNDSDTEENVSEESEPETDLGVPVSKRPNLYNETITEMVRCNKIMCLSSGEKDFGLVDSILIIDEAQELSLEEYALETLFTVDLRNLKVTMGPIELKNKAKQY